MAEPSVAGHGGELSLRGRGVIAVQTDRLQAQLERCARLEASAGSVIDRLRLVALLAPDLAPADRELAELSVRRARELAARLSTGLEAASSAYERLEGGLEATQRRLAAQLAGWAGLAMRTGAGVGVLVLVGTPILLGAAAGWLVAGRLRPEGGSPLNWFVQNPGAITNPAFARMIELVVTSSDDFALGALGVPPAVSALLGEDALGVTGVAAGATLLLAGTAPLGLARETPVSVTRATMRPGPEGAPTGSVDRLGRVPDGDAQLRIERYDSPGQPPRWIVYVGPTYDFVVTGAQPFDMTSNLHAVAGMSPAALRALDLAMLDAGVAASDDVQFVGFSQGGIIAARAASSGNWNAVGLETFGSPIGTIDIPDGVTGIAVRHTDDFVPATGGPDLADDDVLRVERRAYLPGDALPSIPAPAHQRASYLDTAAEVDAAQSQALTARNDELTAFAADYLDSGGELTVYEYRAIRLPTSSDGG